MPPSILFIHSLSLFQLTKLKYITGCVATEDSAGVCVSPESTAQAIVAVLTDTGNVLIP